MAAFIDPSAPECIQASVNLAMHGTLAEGEPEVDDARWPWFFIKANDILLSEIMSAVDLNKAAFIGHVRLENLHAQSEVAARIKDVLQTRCDDELFVLVCGQRPEHPVSRGSNPDLRGEVKEIRPPWHFDGLVIDRLVACLKWLDEQNASALPAECACPHAMAILAIDRPYILYLSQVPPHLQGSKIVKEHVVRSSLAIASGDIMEVARGQQIREAVCKVEVLWQKITGEEVAQGRELRDLVERSGLAISALQVAPTRNNCRRATALMDRIKAEALLYPRTWNTSSWGPETCVFLDALRDAGKMGVSIEELKKICGEDPSNRLSNILKSKNQDKIHIGRRIAELRDTKNDGRYYLYP